MNKTHDITILNTSHYIFQSNETKPKLLKQSNAYHPPLAIQHKYREAPA